LTLPKSKSTLSELKTAVLISRQSRPTGRCIECFGPMWMAISNSTGLPKAKSLKKSLKMKASEGGSFPNEFLERKTWADSLVGLKARI